MAFCATAIICLESLDRLCQCKLLLWRFGTKILSHRGPGQARPGPAIMMAVERHCDCSSYAIHDLVLHLYLCFLLFLVNSHHIGLGHTISSYYESSRDRRRHGAVTWFIICNPDKYYIWYMYGIYHTYTMYIT